jgi:hypothetical protein
MSAGRPSMYSDELAERICDSMVEGADLVTVCKAEDMPARSTVYRWMDERPEFKTRIARAREGLADFYDHKIGMIAEACKAETANADRVKISALQWRASKVAPRTYGDRVATELSGPGGGPIQAEGVGRDLDIGRRLAFLLQKGVSNLEDGC